MLVTRRASLEAHRGSRAVCHVAVDLIVSIRLDLAAAESEKASSIVTRYNGTTYSGYGIGTCRPQAVTQVVDGGHSIQHRADRPACIHENAMG